MRPGVSTPAVFTLASALTLTMRNAASALSLDL